jgi:hypothetical protein
VILTDRERCNCSLKATRDLTVFVVESLEDPPASGDSGDTLCFVTVLVLVLIECALSAVQSRDRPSLFLK